MCVGVATPNMGQVASDYSSMLSAFTAGVPEQLNTENLYKPGFINTALSGLHQTLYGGDNGVGGLLSDFSGAIAPIATSQNEANTLATQGAVSNINNLGPAAAAAVGSVSPDQTALIKALTSTASTQLQAGTNILPSDANRITTTVRGDWAGRGLGDSGPAQLDEALQYYGAGQNALAQRESAAQSAIGTEAQNITLPALTLATQTSGAPGQAASFVSGAGGMAGGAGPTLVPTSELSDALNTSYNASAAANIAGANNLASVIGGALSY